MRPAALLSLGLAMTVSAAVASPAAAAEPQPREAARAEKGQSDARSLKPSSLFGARDKDPFGGQRLATTLAEVTSSTTRLVVRGRPGADLAGIAEQARAGGGTVKRQAARSAAVAVEVPSDQADAFAARLAGTAGVVGVEPAQRYSFGHVPSDPSYAGQQRVYFGALKAERAWDDARGQGVRVAVIDSGVDDTHPELSGVVVGRYNATDGSGTTTDSAGHGTAVASVIAARSDATGMAGAAPAADVLAVKVDNAAGYIWSDAVAEGIRWAVANQAKVINLSLGATSPDQLTMDAVAAARAAGVVVVAAAGNTPSDARHYPAAYPGVVSVGATSADGTTRASFSTYGSWVSLAAPGQDVLAAIPRAQDADGYELVDGTSFSSPLVAAEAALVRSRDPRLTGADVERALLSAHDGKALGFARGVADYAAATAAIPTTRPVFTAPASGSTVTGAVSVSALSSSARVRFGVAGTSITVEAPVVDGTATAVLPSWGVSGSRSITAADCAASLCAGTASSLPVTVTNPAPVISAPAADAVVGTSFVATATAGGGGVRFLVDGVVRGFRAAAPYSLTLPTSALADGPHELTVVSCNSAQTVCDSTSPSEPRVFSVQRLRPTLTAGPSPFSPNADGRRDTATLAYRLEQPQTVDLRITNAAGTVVRAGRLGANRPAGSYSWVWNGKTAAGAVVANGTYTVEIRTSRAVTGGTLSGIAARHVVVDRTPASLTNVIASPATVYPVRDNYGDTTRLAVSTNEALSVLEARVYNSAGTHVRTVRLGAQAAGRRWVTWDGRSASGAVLPTGSYTFALVGYDIAGNARVTGRAAVAVSTKRLVARSATRTVTPSASFRAAYIGYCSDILVPGNPAWAGSFGYYSDYDCDSYYEGQDLAAATHSFTLPAAVRYGAIKIGAYGAAATSIPEIGALVYLRPDGTGTGQGVVLGAAPGLRTGPTVPASTLLNGRTVTWLAGTTDFNWYDVKSYTVTWTYYVLA